MDPISAKSSTRFAILCGLLILLLLATGATSTHSSTAAVAPVGEGKTTLEGVLAAHFTPVPAITFSLTPTATVTPFGGICSTGVIIIPQAGRATPYPSKIEVSGMRGSVSNVAVSLNRFRHDFYDDVDILLVGPQEQSVIVMADVGHTCNGYRDLVFRDGAPPAPDTGCPIIGKIYSPSNYDPDPDNFPTPAPEPPYGQTLAVFNGTNPNGVWKLYVVDDYGILSGRIDGGWCLNITTNGATPMPIPDANNN